MHYGKKEVKTTYSMEGGDIRKNLDVPEEEKDLGVTFDPSLKFSKREYYRQQGQQNCWLDQENI